MPFNFLIGFLIFSLFSTGVYAEPLNTTPSPSISPEKELRNISNEIARTKTMAGTNIEKKKILERSLEKLSLLAKQNPELQNTNASYNNLSGLAIFSLACINTKNKIENFNQAKDLFITAATLQSKALYYKNLGITYQLLAEQYSRPFWNGVELKNRNLLELWNYSVNADKYYELSVSAFFQSQNSPDFLENSISINKIYAEVKKEKASFENNLSVHWFLSKSELEVKSIKISKDNNSDPDEK